MEKETIFNKINELLSDSDYPFEIKDISDLEDFLNDDNNTDSEAFEQIEQLYNKLMEYDDTEE